MSRRGRTRARDRRCRLRLLVEGVVPSRGAPRGRVEEVRGTVSRRTHRDGQVVVSARPFDVLLLDFGGVCLLNPAELMAGQPARFGDAIQLDLGGRGIRDIAWTGREYFLIAGSPGYGGKSRLYRWKGPGHAPRELKVSLLKELNPEGIVVFGTPEKPRLLILSDDGNHELNQTQNISKRTFRMLWVRP